ncbi:MAG: T9SS type A sorting domain-containing protein, partial [Alloprevotella sp.]|nr:T9SS type A sorting domain-containing protein [Alloprevotella sp.]
CFVFTGTYMQVLGTTMYSEGYYALAGGALQQAQDYGVSLGAFRWYLQVLDRASLSAAAPRMIRVKVVGEDDNATGIYPLQSVEAMPAVKVYDINGRLVRQGTRSLDSLPKGVYVINGKKYIK